MKLARYLIPLLIVLPYCSTAQAQCSFWYNLNYATYASESLDGNNNIYTSVVTDGYASMGVTNSGCPDGIVNQMEQAIYNATHAPASWNSISSNNNNWQYGNASCVSCYISEQNNNSIAGTVGTTYNFQAGGQVYCSVGGTVFATFAPPITLTITLSSYKLRIESGGECYYFETCTSTCGGNGAVSAASGWPNGVCPPYLLCFYLAAKQAGNTTCIIGLCQSKLFNPNLCT